MCVCVYSGEFGLVSINQRQERASGVSEDLLLQLTSATTLYLRLLSDLSPDMMLQF